MNTYSYHIFYFPFKWEIRGGKAVTLSEKIDFGRLEINPSSCWERSGYYEENELQNMYNEKNYYYKFVHKVLYDNYSSDFKDNIILHFERKECKVSDSITYNIKVRGRNMPYRLKVDAMNLNLYSTGVGFLSFYLANNDESQAEPQDILNINQYGRRILPPFFADKDFRNETSESISIEGLYGDKVYYEDFNDYKSTDTWKQASFLSELINELSSNISIEPAIDDRMFVASWYKNDRLAQVFTDNPEAYKKDFTRQGKEDLYEFSKFWYRYLFVDGSSETCQNTEMKENLLEEHSYIRWQKWCSLYGCTRYSMVYLTNNSCPEFLTKYFETIYARMVELVLVQRISILRFSDEVTTVSNLTNQEVNNISVRVSSLYKEYIRFINQIYFRDVTAQDQGIELYDMLQKNLKMMEYLKDLDGEIQELFNYISLKEDRAKAEKAAFLNKVAILFVPISFVTGFFGMNEWKYFSGPDAELSQQFLVLGVALLLVIITLIYRKSRKL